MKINVPLVTILKIKIDSCLSLSLIIKSDNVWMFYFFQNISFVSNRVDEEELCLFFVFGRANNVKYLIFFYFFCSTDLFVEWIPTGINSTIRALSQKNIFDLEIPINSDSLSIVSWFLIVLFAKNFHLMIISEFKV